MRRALSSLRSGVFEYERGTDESDLFDSYLASATRVLGRDERGGFSHGAIREVIAAYNAVVNSSELALLEERLALVRRQIGASVTRYSTPGADSPAGLPEVQKEAGNTIRVTRRSTPSIAQGVSLSRPRRDAGSPRPIFGQRST